MPGGGRRSSAANRTGCDVRVARDWHWRGLRGGRVEAQVGVVGQFGGAAAGAFGEVALGQRLQPPGDAFDQPGAVVGGGRLAEDLGVALAQLLGGQPLQGGDLLGDVQFLGFMWVLLGISGSRSRLTGVDSDALVGREQQADSREIPETSAWQKWGHVRGR